jgi:RNA polymerase sigma-70 factor (ECF subfamily)
LAEALLRITVVAVPADTTEDDALVDRIVAGDAGALRQLVEREHATLVRFARAVTRDDDLAREVVQDAWVRIHRGLARFEKRSSLRTWMARIVINRAKTLVGRAARWVPLENEAEAAEDAVDPTCFSAGGFWKQAPGRWHAETPERLLSRQQLKAAIEAQLDGLPPGQRAVLTLRDLEGWDSEEVCNALEISESNQRVLLHRARARVREALEKVLGGGVGSTE